MLELIGFVLVTGLLVCGTWWYLGTIYLQGVFGGFRHLDFRDWLVALVFAIVLIVLWWLWWVHLGSSVSFNASMS